MFLSFAFYSTVLIVKMYVVAIITGQVRLRNKVRSVFLSLPHPFLLFRLGFCLFFFFLLLLILERPPQSFAAARRVSFDLS